MSWQQRFDRENPDAELEKIMVIMAIVEFKLP